MNFLIIVNSFTGKFTPRVDNNIREKKTFIYNLGKVIEKLTLDIYNRQIK